MKFSAPRSRSPSPVRRQHAKARQQRKPSTFGLASDSDSGLEEDYSDSDSSSVASTSSSTSSLHHISNLSKSTPTTARRFLEDTVSSIRLRASHHDPYVEWEKRARKEAFRTARKEHQVTQNRFEQSQEVMHSKTSERLELLHKQQLADVEKHLNAMQLQVRTHEKAQRDIWKTKEDTIQKRIENAIKLDEDKIQAKLAEEKRAREETEKQRKAAELKKRLEEEKRKQEEEQKRKEADEAKQKADEEKRKADEEQQRQDQEEKAAAERLASEAKQREGMGMTTPREDWTEARKNLMTLKAGSTRPVKADDAMRKEWSIYRRQIRPKIGQLTNEQSAITRISSQLYQLIVPDNKHPPAIYNALLSSLAKSILEQAETEVTARKESAIPIAHVVFNLLDVLDGFAEVFYAKMAQRVGTWSIPCSLPEKDIGDRPWDPKEKLKASGVQQSKSGAGTESDPEFAERVAGIMRVYFSILKIPPKRPLKPMFQLPRYWIWFARLLNHRGMLETTTAASLIHTALDVLGTDAKKVWGAQWVKVLRLIYEGVTVGLGNGKFIGGSSPEGRAARVRVELEIERIIKS